MDGLTYLSFAVAVAIGGVLVWIYGIDGWL